jgi:hypothetical protein
MGAVASVSGREASLFAIEGVGVDRVLWVKAVPTFATTRAVRANLCVTFKMLS